MYNVGFLEAENTEVELYSGRRRRQNVSLWILPTTLQRRLAGTLIHCVLLRKQTFRSSAGPRFAVIGLL